MEESSQSDAKDSLLRSDSVTLVPESPNENSMESPAESESTEKSGKRKAPLLEVHVTTCTVNVHTIAGD